jgi:hypothetical protein
VVPLSRGSATGVTSGSARFRTPNAASALVPAAVSVATPTLVVAEVIPKPAKDNRGRQRYVTTRHEGTHQLRHYYASVMLADGVSIKELSIFLGHADPGFTLRV